MHTPKIPLSVTHKMPHGLATHAYLKAKQLQLEPLHVFLVWVHRQTQSLKQGQVGLMLKTSQPPESFVDKWNLLP